MMKYAQFESKNQRIKKRNRLKKEKEKDLTEFDRRKQEIIDKHNVYVAGASSYSERVNTLNEKKHVNKEIILEPQWILDNMPISRYADGKGNIFFYTDENNVHWIILAILTLGIDFTRDEFVVDGTTNEVVISFEISLESIKTDCPFLYDEMKDYNKKTKVCDG